MIKATFDICPIVALRECFNLMGHSQSLLVFKVTNATLDHLVNHLAGLDMTIGEFYGIIVGHPCPTIYSVVRVGGL
jgi:hypothetical protein